MAIVTTARYQTGKHKPFSENVKRADSGCLEWVGYRNPQGYGHALRVIGEPDEIRAHRRAWVIANGDIPVGMHVLHKCDNPACVDVEHLFLGTDADNTADKYRKRRNINLAGAEHGMAKLFPEDVLRIREASLFGASRASLGRAWGVNEATIASIVKRRNWAHLE